MSNRNYLIAQQGQTTLPDDIPALGASRPEDRAGAIRYVVNKYLEAGKKGSGAFNEAAALEAIDPQQGKLQLTGNADQIAAQLIIFQHVGALLRAVSEFYVIEGAQPIRPPRVKAPTSTAKGPDTILPPYEAPVAEKK